MILQKSGNMDVVIKTNTDAKADCHSVPRRLAREEVGMVARSQPPTKLIVERFQTLRGQAGGMRQTICGLSGIFHCQESRDKLLRSGTDWTARTVERKEQSIGTQGHLGPKK